MVLHFLADFQLHPTFSEQLPTNGVKTRLVKMCRRQHTAAYILVVRAEGVVRVFLFECILVKE